MPRFQLLASAGLRTAAFLILAVYCILPLSHANAATTCCACQRTGDQGQTCLEIGSETLTQNKRVNGACALLPSLEGLKDTLKGWTCQPEPLSSSKCKPVPQGGICVGEPMDAYYVEPEGDVVTRDQSRDSGPERAFAPQLNTPIPGFTFDAAPTSTDRSSFLAQYVVGLYRYMLSIVAVAATVMFTYGAFKYLLGSAIPSVKRGKEIMQESIIGMLLVIASTLILRTINPNTLSLSALYIEGVNPIAYTDLEAIPPEGEQGTTQTLRGGGTYIVPKAICQGSACSAFCSGCNAKLPLPEAPWIPDTSQLSVVSITTGLKQGVTGQKSYLRPDAAAALQKAGQIAQSMPGGPYTIGVGDTYRGLKGQLDATCSYLCGQTKKKYSSPGASLHGSGLAADLSLWKGGRLIVWPDELSKQAEKMKQQDVEMLQRIMTEAGFVRYCPEAWHFQFGTPESNDMRTNCPWPPPAP